MDNDERRYLEFQFHAVHDRLDNIDARLNGIDDRITTNAKERLEAIEDLAGDLDEHKKRNHEGSSKALSGGVAGAIAAAMIAVYEMLKRLG